MIAKIKQKAHTYSRGLYFIINCGNLKPLWLKLKINTIENIIVKASDNRKGIEIAISEIGSIKEVKL